MPDSALQAGLKAMVSPFKACDVEAALRPEVEAALPHDIRGRAPVIAMRAADRLIQRQKREGLIRFNQLTRQWIGSGQGI